MDTELTQTISSKKIISYIRTNIIYMIIVDYTNVHHDN